MLGRKKIAIISFLLIVAVLAGLFVYLYSQKPTVSLTEPITVGFFPSEVNSLIYIADDQQYFAANGLNVTFKQYDTGAAALGLLSGEVDIAGPLNLCLQLKL